MWKVINTIHLRLWNVLLVLVREKVEGLALAEMGFMYSLSSRCFELKQYTSFVNKRTWIGYLFSDTYLTNVPEF